MSPQRRARLVARALPAAWLVATLAGIAVVAWVEVPA